MANVDKYAKWVLKWEGGYVNDPLDAGGETNKGITLATWKSAGYDTTKKISVVITKTGKRYTNITASLYEMADEQFTKILKEKYWDKWQADRIKSQSVAEMLVQWMWGILVYNKEDYEKLNNTCFDMNVYLEFR
jgi:lysozyme family protein